MHAFRFITGMTLPMEQILIRHNFFHHRAISIEWQIAADTKIAVAIRDLICPVEQFILRDAPNVHHMDAHRRTHSASRDGRGCF